MALLNVNSLKKVYTTRLGGAKVQALSGVSFTVEEGEFVAIMGRVGLWQDHPLKHPGGAGQTHQRPGVFEHAGHRLPE